MFFAPLERMKPSTWWTRVALLWTAATADLASAKTWKFSIRCARTTIGRHLKPRNPTTRSKAARQICRYVQCLFIHKSTFCFDCPMLSLASRAAAVQQVVAIWRQVSPHRWRCLIGRAKLSKLPWTWPPPLIPSHHRFVQLGTCLMQHYYCRLLLELLTQKWTNVSQNFTPW